MSQIETTTSVLYNIEKAIKAYRKLCQRNISIIDKDITVDQALVLLMLQKNAELSQKELAKLVFKDSASITRMIELMVKKEYIKRSINKKDRRRFNLKMTVKGEMFLKNMDATIQLNRDTALKNITVKELIQLDATLKKIITNCKIN
jgi:DNA-binding MarR family transcriptional regulator